MKQTYLFVTNVLKAFWNGSALAQYHVFQIKSLKKRKYDIVCSLISECVLLCFWLSVWSFSLFITIGEIVLDWSLATAIFWCLFSPIMCLGIYCCYIYIRELIMAIKNDINELCSLEPLCEKDMCAKKKRAGKKRYRKRKKNSIKNK